MIAAGLLLAIAVGVLPLFTKSMLNNLSGSDASTMSNGALDAAEDVSQLRFNAAEISWATAADVWDLPLEFQLLGADYWVAVVPAGEQAQFTRASRVRQYQISGIDVTGVFDAPLPGNADPGAIHLKEVETQVTNERLVGGPRYTLRLVKAY